MSKDFFDENPDLVTGGSGGGAYITKEEKAEMIENGTPFTAIAVRFEEGRGYEGADRHVIDILMEDDDGLEEERLLAFNVGVDSRERFLERLEKFLEVEGNDPARLKLTKKGRSVIIVSADATIEDEEEEEPAPKPKARATRSTRGTKKA